MKSWKRLAGAGVLAGVLAGCGAVPPLSPEDMDRSYEQALARTDGRAVEIPPASEPAQLERLRAFFSAMSAAGIDDAVAGLYASDAYLNDNLVAIEGSAAIAGYFGQTMSRVSSVRVDLLGMAHTGADYFVRWQMTIESPRIRGGAALRSYGVTHFRFDGDGRVLVHKDFWDAGTGLYEHLPVVGSIVRRVRGAAH